MMIKYRRIRQSGHVPHDNNQTYKLAVRKLEGKRLFGGATVVGRIIIKWILKKQGGRLWPEFIWLRIGMNGWSL
jgi:hypothetical protein